MGLQKVFNKALYNELNAYAAWQPVTNTFKVGDYGIFKGGVFSKLGNISEYGVKWKMASGPTSEIDFKSAATKTIRLQGGVEVPKFEGGAEGEAELKFKLEAANSILLKAQLTSEEMQNIREVADALHNVDGWKSKYKVISRTYIGTAPILIGSREAGTEVLVNGSVDAMKAIEGGTANLDFNISSNKESAYKSIGHSGVIALGLFKVGWLFGGPKVLRAEQGKLEMVHDFGEDPMDDLEE